MATEAAAGSVAFVVECGEVELKLTAKQSALAKSFARAILTPFLNAYNQRAPRPVDPTMLEAVLVDGKELLDLDVPVSTFAGRAEARKVQIFPATPRSCWCICGDTQLQLEVAAHYVHLSLREAIVVNVLPTFSQRFRRKLELDDIERVEVDGSAASLDALVYTTLTRGKTSRITLGVRRQVEQKSSSMVFRVKCDTLELKLTLTPKLMTRNLREAVIEPFLKAYSSKRGRPVVCADVQRLIVDGKSVPDTLLTSSVVSGGGYVRVEIELAAMEVPTKGRTDIGTVDYSKWKSIDPDAEEAGEAGGATVVSKEALHKKNRSLAEWDSLKLDESDEERGESEPSAAREEVPKVDGKALLRDSSQLSGGWVEEAETLFALSPEKVFSLGLEYPANQIEDLVLVRAGEAVAARVAEAKKGVSECIYYIKPGEGAPGGREARCVLYMPQLPKIRKPKGVNANEVDENDAEDGATPIGLAERAARMRKKAGLDGKDGSGPDMSRRQMMPRRGDSARGRGNHWVDPAVWAAEEDELWAGIERHPERGRPLVILAHNALGHARSAHELWLAWYLVKQYRCCVLALDYLPHHGIRTPDGSHSAHRAEAWPAAELGEEHTVWSSTSWEDTLDTIADDFHFALEIALAAPAPGASSSLQASLHAMQEKRRERLFNSFGPRGRLIDPGRVAFFGHGLGGTLGVPFLARAKGKLVAAALNMCSATFPTKASYKQRSNKGIEVLEMEIPGTLPSPPAEAFASRLLSDASSVTIPVYWVASEKDSCAPIESARQLYEALGTSEKTMRVLPGARLMSVAELQDQLVWLMQQLDIYEDQKGIPL